MGRGRNAIIISAVILAFIAGTIVASPQVIAANPILSAIEGIVTGNSGKLDAILALDHDSDGVPDVDDNCPFTSNADQADIDVDGIGDVCDDSDGDGVFDSDDICQGFDDTLDADGDGVPDDCDLCEGNDASGDTDEDGVCDDIDVCPLNPDDIC